LAVVKSPKNTKKRRLLINRDYKSILKNYRPVYYLNTLYLLRDKKDISIQKFFLEKKKKAIMANSSLTSSEKLKKIALLGNVKDLKPRKNHHYSSTYTKH
jgi:hypothetical protein